MIHNGKTVEVIRKSDDYSIIREDGKIVAVANNDLTEEEEKKTVRRTKK